MIRNGDGSITFKLDIQGMEQVIRIKPGHLLKIAQDKEALAFHAHYQVASKDDIFGCEW